MKVVSTVPFTIYEHKKIACASKGFHKLIRELYGQNTFGSFDAARGFVPLHTHQNEYQCEVCEAVVQSFGDCIENAKRFTTFINMVRQKHLHQEYSFDCPACNLLYDTSGNLKFIGNLLK